MQETCDDDCSDQFQPPAAAAAAEEHQAVPIWLQYPSSSSNAAVPDDLELTLAAPNKVNKTLQEQNEPSPAGPSFLRLGPISVT